MSRRNRRRKTGSGATTQAPGTQRTAQPPPLAHTTEPPKAGEAVQNTHVSASLGTGPTFAGPRLPVSGHDEVSSALDSTHHYSIILLGALCICVAALTELSGAAEASWVAATARFWIRVGADLLKEFGVALVIAWFMILTVEKVTRKEMLKQHRVRLDALATHHQRNIREIEENVFRHLLNLILDKSVVDEFLISMISSRFVRRGLELSYEFDRPPAGVFNGREHELLRVKVTVQYELHLIAGESEDTSIEHYFESTICEHETFDRIESVEITGCDLPGDCPANEVLRRYKVCHGIRQGFNIPQVVLKFGEPARIKYSYQVLRRYSDSETYVTTVPADGLKVRVAHVDDAVAHLRFSLDWNHRMGFERNRNPMDANTRGCLAMNRAFLPNQGFVLYWYPKAVLEGTRRRGGGAAAVETILRKPK